MRRLCLLMLSLGCTRADGASAAIGTANPIRIDEHAPDGTWVIACQARVDTDGQPGTSVEYSLHGDRGDRLVPYLIYDAGPGLEIGAFANQSPDGHWLAVVRGGKLELHDAVHRRSVELVDADTEDDAGLDYHSRVASFANTRMIYFRKVKGRDVVVVRELASGAERVVDVPGTMWRADVDPAGRWARLRVFRTDDNGDGKIEWADRGLVQLHGCFQGDPHALAYRAMTPHEEDTPTTLWLDLASGKLVADPTIVHAVGDGLLRQLADGSLTLDNAKLVPAACHAKILGIAVTPPRVIVACGKTGADKGTLGVYGPKLAVTDPHPGDYKDPTFGPVRPSGRHLCPMYSDVCIDVTTGAVTSLGGGVSVWHQTGDLAFVFESAKERVFVWDAAAGARTAFPQLKDSFPDVGDTLASIAGEHYDWVHNVHLGKASEWIHVTDTRGRVLVGPPQTQPNHLPDGPVHWEKR